MSFFNLLPEDIFKLIRSFLSSDDYHYFLNTSKKIFSEFKYKNFIFSLNNRWSRQYIDQIDFQTILLSKVENGWNQIAVRLSTFTEIPRDLPIHKIVVSGVLPVAQWNNYHSIQCNYQYAKIPPLPNVRELTLMLNGGSIELTYFQHLTKLELYDTYNLPTDLTPLRNIPYLTIGTFKDVEDFSMFSNQKYLKLLYCKLLTNVNSFQSIHKLELVSCHNLTNITPLNGIYDLHIIDCKGIKDISGLGNHHCLVLKGCSSKITSFDCLMNIPHVSLETCFIKDITVCQYAKSIYLTSCPSISDVSSLKNVKNVKIITENELIGLHELGNVNELSLHLTHYQEINDDVLLFLHNQRLKIFSQNMKITSLSVFSRRIKHLTIGNCDIFARWINADQGSLLQHLTSLTLNGVGIERLKGLGSIPNIHLTSCNYIKSLDGLGRNRSVIVENCRRLEDVSSLATVPIVTIRFCSNLSEKSYECLKNVPRLKILKK